MFESLSEKLSGILDKLTGRGALSEEDVNAAMREVRRALLEADVALEVVRSFIDRTRTKAIGAAVVKSIKPGQMVVKIVHDSLIETLGGESQSIDLNAPAPVAIMLVGLQGAGKTTTAAKIAKRLTERNKVKVLMASLDVKRPAAQEQLAVLGRQVGVETLPIVPGQDPVAIARRAESVARLQGYDVVLLDTAGRTHIDEPLMAEMAEIRDAAKPHEILLGGGFAHRPGRGQSRQELQRARRRHRHRAHPRRWRRARRRRAFDARGHRQADQASRRRRKDGRARGFPSSPPRRPHPRDGRHRQSGREGGRVDRHGAGGQDGREDAEGHLRFQRHVGAIRADRKARRHGRHHEHAAGHGQDEGSAGRGQSRRDSNQAPARDHRLDDGQGAAQSAYSHRRPPQGLAQEAHRRRRGGQRRGGQQVDQAASRDGRHDEGDGRRKGQARHDGPARADDGHGRRNAATDAGADRSLAKADGWAGPRDFPPRRQACRLRRRPAPSTCRRNFPAWAGPARGCPASVA